MWLCVLGEVLTPALQKNAIAVAQCKKGKGILKVNGFPIELLQPALLRLKLWEPVLLVGREKFEDVDIRIRVSGGGHNAQIFGARPPSPPPPL